MGTAEIVHYYNSLNHFIHLTTTRMHPKESARKIGANPLKPLWIAAVLASLLVSPAPAFASKAEAPAPATTVALMRARGMATGAPVLVRVFKKEAELEVWKQQKDGRYALLKTFPVCRWSGRLGPKRKTGDRQAPEGFYEIGPRMMNPNSSYHLSFDTGFPNAYDRAHGYTGSYLMVHGACSSMGCYAMTNAGVEEVYALLRDAFRSGQKSVQFQAFPFRMTARNMARMRDDPDIDFWRQLKVGHDRFEATARPPLAALSGKRYAFTPYKDKGLEELALTRIAAEQDAIRQQIDDGAPAVRATYADGGMHPHFARMRNQASLGVISRPEALAQAGRETVIRPGVRREAPVLTARAAASLTFVALAGPQISPPALLQLPPPALAPTTSAAVRIALAHDGARDVMASNASPDGGAPPSPAAFVTTAWTRTVLAMGPSIP